MTSRRADSLPNKWLADAVTVTFTIRGAVVTGPLTSITPLPRGDGRIELGIGTFVTARIPADTPISRT